MTTSEYNKLEEIANEIYERGLTLCDKKDENITGVILQEYRFYYLVEVHAPGGKYRETVRKDDLEKGDSRWRVL